MTRPSPGFACCPSCGKRVLFALAASGEVLAFDAAFEDGSWVVRWDVTGTPRCRAAASGQVAGDEYRYQPHAETCGLADVLPLASAPSLRPRPARPEPRRSASAR